MKRFNAGDKVRFTRAYLRSTGQIAGKDANGKWIVQDCACAGCKAGDFVLTNEPTVFVDMYTTEEVNAEPWLRFRHINAGNLELTK